MRTAGHTVLIATKMAPDGYEVTLECTCGLVFWRRNALGSELRAAEGLVLEEGRSRAAGHIARIEEARGAKDYQGMSFSTELTVDVRAETPEGAQRLSLNVESMLMAMQMQLGKNEKVRWFASKPVDRVPEKAAG